MIHLQRTVPDWDQAIHRLPDGALVKVVDEGQQLALVKGINPNINTCLRHWYDQGQVFGGTFEQNKERARAFFETFIDGTFIDQIAPHCDYIEEWNEYLANSQNSSEIDERVRWARAAAEVWRDEYRVRPELAHIRLVLCNTAIGNWIHRDFAVAARDYDCAIGYHPYTLWQNRLRWGEDAPLDYGVLDTLDWVNLSGLWDAMEFDWGIKVDWLFTEAGPFESAVDGWRSSSCLGADRDLYVAAVRDWIRDVQQTPAYAEGRIKGFALYTTGRAGDTWRDYWTEQPELNSLADMIKIEWNPGAPTIPPPLPPPQDECQGMPRVQYSRVVNVVHEGATEEEAVEIFREAWRRGRETVGGSYDDAGIGALNQKMARCYGIAAERQQEFQEWFDQWYPGTFVEFRAEPAMLLWPLPDRPPQTHYETWAVFDAPRDYEGDSVQESRHEGLDMHALMGDRVVASKAGEVIWASNKIFGSDRPSRYGNHVVIEHGDGLRTWYCHLDDLLSAVGDVVERGDVIGYAGNSSTVPMAVHLHFNVQRLGHGLDGYVVADVVDPRPMLGIGD